MSEVAERANKSGASDSTSARRKMTLRMRQARERLTTSPLDPGSYGPDLVRMFAQSHKSATPALCVLILAVGATVTLWVPIHMSLAWMSLALMAAGVLYGFSVVFLERPRLDSELGMWRRKFLLAETFNGVAWA